MKEFTVKFHLADSEYMTALRLVCGAYSTVCDLDLDTAEDFKVCVTESAIILKNCGFESVCAVFGGDKRPCCTITGEGGIPKESENDLSLALISALIEDCAFDSSRGVIRKVTLKL